tara:strand:- start:749 stop:1003 length:255 start_codon:yes stop_codon:yes gene_type:complete
MVLLTRREIEVILSWKERVDWPDEKRVVAKLERALDTPEDLHLSAVQIGIIRAWAEEQVGGHFGRAVMNPEEQAILRKVSEEQE